MTTPATPRSIIETRRICKCGREVDAIRIMGETGGGLRISRHLAKNGPGFCGYSLDEVPRGKMGRGRPS